MFEDAKLWYDFANNIYSDSFITVFGRGIGATFATYVASLNNPKVLLLESPMYDMAFTGKYLYPYTPFKTVILKYKFKTCAYIKNVKCRIYIFHGKLNGLIDYRNSVKLHEIDKNKIGLYIIEDGNHYNLINHEVYLNKVNEILQ